jgi:lauroyl/myristoyl acyltransferase
LKSQPLITRHDVQETAILAVESLIAWTVYERLWPRFCQVFAQLSTRLHRSRTRELRRELVRACDAIYPEFSPASLEIAIRAAHMESRLQLLREYRPDGWRPRLRLLGKHHIEAALAAGRGAILWLCPFTYNNLVAHKTLHTNSLDITRLGGAYHGFASIPPSRFGMRILNPLRTRVEGKYLAERIVIPPDGSLGYLRVLRKRLEDNHLVSITANGEGNRAPLVPFLDGGIRLATGPASLALSTGAALLPVFLSRCGAGHFETTIEAPLVVFGADCQRAAAEQLTGKYAELLERYVVQTPQLWPGWREYLDDAMLKSGTGRQQ